MRTIQKTSIWTFSPEALGYPMVAGASLAGNGAWPASNDALFIPFSLERPCLVGRLFCMNGNVVSGNVDMGIYTYDGARIVSIGSTAQAGTSAPQFFNITDTYLSPGQYYMAVALSNTSGTFRRFSVSIIRLQQYGVLKATSAFALPASVTFATVTATLLPSIGMELLGVV